MIKKTIFGIIGIFGAFAGFLLWSQNDQLNMESLRFDDLDSGIIIENLNPILPQMTLISADEFLMGSNENDTRAFANEKPVHHVVIAKAFEIGKYEVTFAEYDVFAKSTGRRLPADNGWGRVNRPVINVSWYDAVEYAKWLSKTTTKKYRLPTEAEWEYAARAKTKTPYWWGEKFEKNRAQCKDCLQISPRKTSIVGTYATNGFGLHDTAGNVTEWVFDCYQPDYTQAPSNGSQLSNEGCAKRSIRGGSWYNESITLRSSHRSGLAAEKDDNNGGGFRLVRDL